MSKAYVNVIIPKTGRDNFLDVCLFYLDRAASTVGFGVYVYVIDNTKLSLPKYNNIKVKTYQLTTSKIFNKALLLNYGLSVMKQDFWFVSIVDVDMIYSKDFFLRLESIMTKRTYVFSTGVYLSKESTNEMIRSRPEVLSIEGQYPKLSGPSQVTMHNNVLKLFKYIYGDKLYCEDFIGWGGEDSDLSYKSRDMYRKGFIDRSELKYVWYHMYHDNARYNAGVNKCLYIDRKSVNREILDNVFIKNREVNYEQVS